MPKAVKVKKPKKRPIIPVDPETGTKVWFDKSKPYEPKYKSFGFDDRYYVKVYLLARQGMSDQAISKVLKVHQFLTFRRWKMTNPAFREALEQGRRDKEMSFDLKNFVEGRLPPKLLPLWKEICVEDAEAKEEGETNKGRRKRIEKILSCAGKRARQYIWLHALVASNFNYADACRKANISRMTLNHWLEDERFLEIADRIVDMKKDFIEGCLMGLVAQGDTNATIFAAKTLLRDRGYDTKMTVEHTGKVNHKHAVMNIDKVIGNMSPAAQKELLDAISDPKALPPRTVTTEEVDDE